MLLFQEKGVYELLFEAYGIVVYRARPLLSLTGSWGRSVGQLPVSERSGKSTTDPKSNRKLSTFTTIMET